MKEGGKKEERRKEEGRRKEGRKEGRRKTKQKQDRAGNAHYGAVAVAKGRKEEEQDHSTELAWRRKGRSMTCRLRVNLLPRK